MTIRSIEYAKNVQQINVLSWQLSTEEQQKNRISKCQGWGYPVSDGNRFKRFNSFLTHQTWSSLGKRSGHFQGSFRVVHTYFHNAWTIWIIRFNPSRSKLFFFCRHSVYNLWWFCFCWFLSSMQWLEQLLRKDTGLRTS